MLDDTERRKEGLRKVASGGEQPDPLNEASNDLLRADEMEQAHGGESQQPPTNDKDRDLDKTERHNRLADGDDGWGIREEKRWGRHIDFIIAYVAGIGSIVTCENWAVIEAWVSGLGGTLWHVWLVLF